MAGYTRQDVSNNISDGNIINASDFDNEYNAIEAAFNAATGHTHDGTAAEGAPITKIGPTQDVVASASALTPKVDNTVDLGSSSFEYKDLYIDGTANIDTLIADVASIVANTSNDALRITQTGSGNAFVVEDSTSPDSSPFVIDATGKLILGRDTSTTTRVGGTNFAAGFQSSGTSLFQPSTAQFVYESTGATSCAYSLFARSRDATLGSQTIVQDGDRLGALSFAGSDGTQFSEAARIVAEVDGAPGTDDMPGRLVFSTTPDGSATPTERMRIDSAGNVGVGTTSPNTLLHVSGSSTSAIARISSTGSGGTTFDGSGAGVEITANNMNTSSKYTPALKFGSTDTDFTTTNPKFGAAILAEAAQTYSSDTAGGMDLLFWTSPTDPGTGNGLVERMRIDSAGNIGIGATPEAWDSQWTAIDIKGASGIFAFNSAFDPAIISGVNVYVDGASSTANAKYKVSSEQASMYRQYQGVHAWFTAPTGTADTAITFTQAMTLTAAGNLGIGTSSPAVKLDVSGAVRASTGVLFGTDTATANTLDDYEEGTWTPEVADAVTGGNVASAGTFSGSYTKVGRLVTITCLAANIGTSGMTSGNDVYVRGLPFTAASFSNTQMFTGAMLLTWTAITTQTAANLIDNTAYVRISENVVGAGFDYVTVGELTSAASDIYFTITYEAA